MNKNNMTTVREFSLPESGGSVSLVSYENEYVIHRYAARGKVNNWIENYELINSQNESSLLPITLDIGNKIIDIIASGENYSNAYIFYSDQTSSGYNIALEKSPEEHKYTSTGIKFWRHSEQMFNYKNGDPNTVISTHISPEGSCNLRCGYCSVTYRDTHSRLELDTIKDYVLKLKTRGLRAVILTGGGEPTIYKHFNELVRWLKAEGLSVALITNGTRTSKVADDVWGMFSWIRVSINIFVGWEYSISLPKDKIDYNKTIVGCSMVYTSEHEMTDDSTTDRVDMLKRAALVADNCGASYIRLLPNCLLTQDDLIRQHAALDNTLKHVSDTRFFHQYKIHGAPKTSTCHQSYFRPYLSEEIHKETGKPGTVYPCDSVVLNEGYQHFAEEYQLCHASDVLDYIDKKVAQRFDAKTRCAGCVFTDNVNMLDDFVNGKLNRFSEFTEPLNHEEFV